jgi:3-deoxy-D-manno-octulosonate 8-phosphate phosphatase KdsC-like HAD superfamily phosphatase
MDRVYADHMKAVRLLLTDVDGTLVTREKVLGPLPS